MKRVRIGVFGLFALAASFGFVFAGQPAPQRSAKEALQPLQDLIGAWRGEEGQSADMTLVSRS